MNHIEGLNRLSFFAVFSSFLLFLYLWTNNIFDSPDRELIFSVIVAIVSVFFIQSLKWIISGFKKST